MAWQVALREALLEALREVLQEEWREVWGCWYDPDDVSGLRRLG